MRINDEYNNIIRELANAADSDINDGTFVNTDEAIREAIYVHLIADDDLYTVICANVRASDLWNFFYDDIIDFLEADIADAMENC